MPALGPLYVIDSPPELLGSVAGALLAVTARGVVQARLAAGLGDRAALQAGHGSVDPRRHLEVYGVVAWVIGGFGWGAPHPQGWRTTRRARLWPALAGILTLLALTAATGLAARGVGPGSASGRALLYGSLTLAGFTVLSAVPVPPLDGWLVLRALARPSQGLERARLQLEERNLGIVIALLLVLAPSLFRGLPDPVGRLAVQLLRALQVI